MFWLGAASLASVAAAPAAWVWAIFSPLVFDRIGSLLNPLAWIAFLLMISLWIICLLAPCAAWVTFTRGDQRRAWILMSAPPVWLGAMVLMFVFL